MRKRVRSRSDRSFFSRSARRTKAINVTPRVLRGGIRL